MLMITFSSKKQQYEELKKRYKLMLENNEATMWDTFEKKIDMLIEELYCFIDIVDDLNNIQKAYEMTKTHRDTLKQKLADMINSDVEMVGFFTRKPKAEKIQEYRNELKQADEMDDVYKRILNLISAVIVNNEIDKIKHRKKLRYDDALKIYSQQKMKTLEDCKNFWECVHDDYESSTILESKIGDYQL